MKNKPAQTKRLNRNHPAFNKNAGPFYRIIMEGLKGEVDEADFGNSQRPVFVPCTSC
jgi:hypothetical protein